jgi:signal transduction histidine kinase
VNVTDLVENLIREDPNLQPPQALVQIERLDAVLGHKALLMQCFSNLLNNAAKFVPPGAVPKIRIHSEIILTDGENLVPFPRQQSPPPANKMVRFWVDDNGIGVPKEDQQRVFELFHRVHEGYEGTGLGLSIVRKATERMGGMVGVESEPSQGSKFWLQLHAA